MEIEVRLDDLQGAARNFWQQVEGKVFAFHGAMGAGKTTFITALCIAKGVTGHVSSPTFSIINEYTYTEKGEGRIMYHIDLYRLKDEEEAIQAGIEDCLYSGNICLVEWPERIAGIMPGNEVHIYINAVNNDTRRLKIIAER